MQSASMMVPEASYPGLKPGEVSTGTTIMAIPTAEGVVLGADSRVSTGTYVANRVSDKIAQMSDHIFACRSGSAADTQALTDYVKFYLQQLTYVERENTISPNQRTLV
jgi:20S proteasome subunit beta 1